MIKLIYCLRRVPTLSLAEFQAHWREHHARFGREIGVIRRYIQYHRLEDDPTLSAMAQAEGNTVEPFDGVAMSWWDDVDALRAGMASTAVAAALEDERHFIDHSRSTACLTTERVIIEPIGDVPYVLIECLRRRDDIDRAEFSRRWAEHAKIGLRANAAGLLMGYIQNVTLLDGAQEGLEAIAGDQAWDGVTTGYFESVAKYKALLRSPLVIQDAWEDECRFMDHARCAYLLTRRNVVKELVR
jgi:EthD domain